MHLVKLELFMSSKSNKHRGLTREEAGKEMCKEEAERAERDPRFGVNSWVTPSRYGKEMKWRHGRVVRVLKRKDGASSGCPYTYSIETGDSEVPLAEEFELTSEDEDQKGRRMQAIATKRLTDAMKATENWKLDMWKNGGKKYYESRVEPLETATARAKQVKVRVGLVAKAEERFAEIWDNICNSE